MDHWNIFLKICKGIVGGVSAIINKTILKIFCKTPARFSEGISQEFSTKKNNLKQSQIIYVDVDEFLQEFPKNKSFGSF